jgi:hypothetical protein
MFFRRFGAQHVTAITMLIVVPFVVGCPESLDPSSKLDRNQDSKDFQMDQTARDRSAALDLNIKLEGKPSRTHITLQAVVTNLSNAPVAFDKEFSIFLFWELWSVNEKRPLKPKSVGSQFERTRETLSKKRFVLLEPGKALSRKVVLTDPFRAFQVEAVGTPREGKKPLVTFRGFEEQIEYHVPPECQDLGIQLKYRSNRIADMAFYELFRFRKEEVKFWNGQCESNEVIVHLIK